MAPEERLQKNLVRAVLMAPVIIVVGLTLYAELNWNGYWRFLPAPQPIPFNHKLHVDRGIDCQYCHRGSEKGTFAGVPSVTDCYQCHQGATGEGSFGEEVNQRPDVQVLIQEYVEQRRDIEWFKYYDMPEHVRFSHKAHINAGLECTACHGEVETMEKIVMKQKPTMGWCVSCHRVEGAPQDCTTCHY